MPRGRLHIPRWVCIGAIALGASALVIQAAIDVHQGTRDMILLSPEWLTQAWQMTLLTGFVLAFAAIGGCLLNARAWIRASILYLLVLGYMAITITNSMDFVADNTLAMSAAARTKATQTKDIAEIRNATTLSERKEMLEGVWRTYYSAKTASEKATALAQIKDITRDGPTLVADDVHPIKAGSGGIWHRWLGWRQEAVQEAKAVALPILIMIGKAVAITLGFAFYPTSGSLPPARNGQSKAMFGPNIAKFNKDDARADLVMLSVTGALDKADLTGADLAERWGVSRPTASTWLAEFGKEKLILRQRQGLRNRLAVKPAQPAASMRKSVERGDNHAPAINGRAHAV